MQPLETIQLSSIQRIREWQDGFEELQSIPNSFALEIKDMHDPWSMFTDSSEDKVRKNKCSVALAFADRLIGESACASE